MSRFRIRESSAYLFLLAVLLAIPLGCGQPDASEPVFAREQAIKKATEDAERSVPEVGIQEARVYGAAAELITLKEADQRFGGERGPRGYAPGQDDDTPVWWVSVAGYFRYEGMPQPDGVRPIYESTRRDFIYDARTGESVGSRIPAGLVTQRSEQIAQTPPSLIMFHDRGKDTRLEPGSDQFNRLAAGGGEVLQRVRPGIVEALALPWQEADRIKQNRVALEMVYSEPGVQVADHGVYTSALVVLDEPPGTGEGSVFLGGDQYTRVISVSADASLAELRRILGLDEPEPSGRPADPTEAPALPVATPRPSASPTPSTMAVKVYFSRVVNNDVEFVPVERTVARSPAVGRAAIEELLKGPTPEEKARGLSTSIPEGARLLSLKIVYGVAYVDFDEALQFQVGGSLRVMVIRKSITLTLLQFPTVQSVVISIEGRTEDILQP